MLSKNILITGGAGMIGSNLCSRLLADGHNVTVIDNLWRGKLHNLSEKCGPSYDSLQFYNRDLSTKGDWENLFKNIDVVFHLADIVGGIGYVFNNESYIFNQNLLINANVSNAVKKFNVPRYIYVGTACSFPKDLQYGTEAPPMKEEQQMPANPESAYGWSKLMGELDAKFLSTGNVTESVILVLHNVYGSPTDYSSTKSQVIPALVYKCLKCQNTNKKLEVWGNGEQGRAFVHVQDVVSALVKSLNKGGNCGPIQIGPSSCSKIKDIATKIKNFVDPEIEIIFDKSKPIGDIGRCADFSKAYNTLGWKPKISLDEGIKELVNWIKHQEIKK